MGTSSSIYFDDTTSVANLQDTVFEAIQHTNDKKQYTPLQPQKQLKQLNQYRKIKITSTIYPQQQPQMQSDVSFTLQLSQIKDEILEQILAVILEEIRLPKELIFIKLPNIRELVFQFEGHKEIVEKMLVDVGVI
ncbi:hypothetical protein SS50377_28021 [Spironucleus salmonicida]|uniref:Uncharacterized protein n=1 Tax=Spironucleus salmonicida TaxID=348837 RepID=V6LDL9_9EUKA|nr:hypothetical protein SS50377_28021 [Spironucleus salmonicida]|eukprot:EST42577.1 Hypothetical protein SS50377_17894 [Spironucleus salmonicida]